MKVIVGLGNPGREYDRTRHNIGFMIIDELAEHLMISLDKTKFNGIYGVGTVKGEKVILLKPLTYMNLSGESLKPLMSYYDVSPEDILVIYDDLDLPSGKVRLRTKGSAGGHNGIKSIVQHLKTQEFNRIRVGIDRPTNGMKISDYVLGKFTNEEMVDMKEAIDKSIKASEDWIHTPFLEVMNRYN
ncbi:aminoacyl-tRNA hydrolase [Metabacillus iocasae]|uniref:Peptidyl-tRNA hydrolase n=1 Tax=Priestia iocasae TaxID=2291674 RepID=A0ABS2QZS5_9BACI|nr:aminoacyl-tRNA hydrolase [Metabacillus iocasae]MBM7704912.1 PTH1 family peptidyl-tRNA hydrolase [Metabacillus iocasae]